MFSLFLRLVLIYTIYIQYRRTGNSVGGVVELVARNIPSGLGAPVFDKMEAELAKACMSLPAAKGFEVSPVCILEAIRRLAL